MQKIYSKVNSAILLHLIHKISDINKERDDLAPSNEFLQVSALKMSKNRTFKPHKHNTILKETNITQESWVVIKGSVKAFLYDLDDQIIAEEILNEGDISVTFRGGHNYLILSDDTIVYEFKTGPYFGQKEDKTFIC